MSRIHPFTLMEVMIAALILAMSVAATTAIVGTLLCFAWAKAVPDKGSLKKEN